MRTSACVGQECIDRVPILSGKNPAVLNALKTGREPGRMLSAAVSRLKLPPLSPLAKDTPYLVVINRELDEGRAWGEQPRNRMVQSMLQHRSGIQTVAYGAPYPPFSKQLALFANMQGIVGFHGAAFANLLFATKPDLAIYEVSIGWNDGIGPCRWRTNHGIYAWAEKWANWSWTEVYLPVEFSLRANAGARLAAPPPRAASSTRVPARVS